MHNLTLTYINAHAQLCTVQVIEDDEGNVRWGHTIYYEWENVVYCYDELTQGPRRAERIGTFVSLQ